MLTQIGNRRSTNDDDVLLKDVERSTNSPLYQTFKAAIRAVTRTQTLPSTWLNDLIGDFLRAIGTPPEGTLWRTYGVLEVLVPPVLYGEKFVKRICLTSTHTSGMQGTKFLAGTRGVLAFPFLSKWAAGPPE